MSEPLKVYQGWFDCPQRGRVAVYGWNELKVDAENDLSRYISMQSDGVLDSGIVSKEVATQEWPKGEAVVLLDEEYGYRTWLWHTNMTGEELIAWWTALPSVDPYFMTPVGLPGTLVPCWVQSNADKGVWTFKRDSVTQDEEGNWQGEEVFVYWPVPGDPRKDRWMAHIHQDDDSGLGHPTHGRFRHAGFDDYEYEEGAEQ